MFQKCFHGFLILLKTVIQNLLHTAKYMHQILDLSLDAYDELFKEIDTTGLVERKGILYGWTR